MSPKRTKTKANSVQRTILKGCVVFFLGDFGAQRTRADLNRWVTANGGKVTRTMGSDVTQ
jgi:hypothetical protein